MKGSLIIISSPSGGGKGTLIKEILQNVPNVGYSVSYTTREMRQGETDGRDYFFINVEEFNELIAKGEFLEFAEVHGNFYGTSLNQVLAETNLGRDVILEIDVQGAKSVRRKIPEAVSIFILPPSFEVLRRRLVARQTEKREELEIRLQNSFGEVKHFTKFEYIVINDEVSGAAKNLEAIILAERQRRFRQADLVQVILDSFDASKSDVLGE
ncbi:MAG: guanylate kinase [Acidobacteriota bacterium]|nr:guanylate kinase [Acidobacteriota bacterium]